MKKVRWNALKSERLKKTRGVSFEEIIRAKLVGVLRHPNRTHQSILVYDHKGYLWAVPYVAEGDSIFLKTIYPSRKLMNKYRRRNHEKDQTD